jgi:hypothetical protein
MNQFIKVFPAILLAFNGVVYVAIGIIFSLDAERWFGNVGVTLADPVGFTELRAVYGGLMLAMGIFFLLSIRVRNWLVPGTAFLLISYFGLVLARSQGIFLLGQSTPVIMQIYLIEWVCLILSAIALRMVLRTANQI